LIKASHIEVARKRRVLTITLNRPEKRNALNLALCRELTEAFDKADCDRSVGAIVLNANGPVFSAGMDLKEVLEIDENQIAAVHERLFTTIRRVRTPIVAAVHGQALGGGTGLVANSHIVVADPGARFGMPEVRVGLWPVLIFRSVVQAMGERRTVELALTGREFSAAEAVGYGLVTEIVAEPLERAMEIASTLGALSPIALKAGLDHVQQVRGLDWEQAGRVGRLTRDRLLSSEDFKEGARAFLEKRPPSWPSLIE
jgi:enoyl-CoA hydratase/carnithine racemase